MDPNRNFGFSNGSGSWAKMPMDQQRRTPLSMMAPPNLPLPPTAAVGSFQEWRQPFWMNQHTDVAGGTGWNTSGVTNTHLLQPNYSTDNVALANRPANTTPAINIVPGADGNDSSSDSEADNNAGAEDRYVNNNNKGKIVNVNGVPVKLGRSIDVASLDPKRVKRMISNRASAQRSRLKKLQYVAEMEKKAKDLEAQIAILAPQVEYYTQQQQYLQMEQESLNEKIAAYTEDKILNDAEIEANMKEVARLRELHMSLEQQPQMQSNEANARLMGQMVNPPSNQSAEENMKNSSSNQAGESTGDVNMQNQAANVAEDKQQNQQAAGKALVAEPRKMEPASPNQPEPHQNEKNSNLSADECNMEDVMDTEQNQSKEHAFI